MAAVKNDNNYKLTKNDFFISSVSKKFVINSVISMIFLYASSLIDTLLVGIFLGEEGLSAMSLVSPVYLIYYTIGATVGIGANIAASRELGKENTKEYRSIFTCASLLLFISVLVMTVLGYAFLNPFGRLLCGNKDGIDPTLVIDYLRFYIPGGAFTLIAYIPLYFLKTEGKPKISSRLFSLSAVINIVLSWLFMSPIVDMGIGGASLATTISMGTVAIIGFIYLIKGSKELKFVKGSLKPDRIWHIVLAGIPNGLANLLESAQILMINMLLISIGAESMLSCYTVLRNIMGIESSIIVGISSAILPLIGVFFGERDYQSERQVIKNSIKTGLLVMAPLIAVAVIFAPLLFKLFGVTDSSIIEEGRYAVPLACIGLLAGYLNALYSSYLTSIKHEWTATILVALRTFGLLALFAIPFAYIFGSMGIWASFSIAEVCTLLSFFIIRAYFRKKNPALDKYLLNTSYEKDGDISFSVKSDVSDIVSASEKVSEYCENHDIDMKKCMKASLAIEELLTFLLKHMFKDGQQKYVDVRVCKLENEVMLRFRYVGEIFDPIHYYNDNMDNEALMEDLLGIKILTKSASLVDFRQTLGTNNLIIIF